MALLFVLVALVSMQNRASLAAGAADIPNDRAAVEHALNRLAFGPKPGQVEAVQRLGLSRWLDQQLNPSGIDEAALAARLTPLPDRPGDIGRVAARNLSEQERMEAQRRARQFSRQSVQALAAQKLTRAVYSRSEEHTSELQSRLHLVCRRLLEKKKMKPARCCTRTGQAREDGE